MKILIVDNNIDLPWTHCADLRRYMSGRVVIRRGPERDLPPTPMDFTHIILSGSRTSILDSSVWVQELMQFVRTAADANVPLLGVCYGHQIIARAFGGDQMVRKSPMPEFGWVEIEQTSENPLLKDLPKKFHSFQSHEEEVQKVPDGFIPTASSARCPIQAYYIQGKPVFGVQFHPERNTEEGSRTIEMRKKVTPRDCIFPDSKAKSLYSEHVANTIFRNFLSQRR
ncbi:MAG: type 1 glutamine amidotransferase [Bdellovibrionota bacterium]